MSRRSAIFAVECAVQAGIALWIFMAPTIAEILRRFGWSVLFLAAFAALMTIWQGK